MIFGTYQLLGEKAAASLSEMQQVCKIGPHAFEPLKQKNLYMLETEIIDDRFFWLSCDYDDAESYRNYVINKETKEREPNPKGKKQIELKKQFFACYDTLTGQLYLSDFNRKATLAAYLSDSIQKTFSIKNIYSSMDEFCAHIKTLRGFRFVQKNNLFSRSGNIFQQIGNMWGQNLPSQVYMKIAYDDMPIHQGRSIIEKLYRQKNEFEEVVVVGHDDNGIESTFDLSSMIKRIEISPLKDDNEQYNPIEVRDLLLSILRK